MTPAAQAVLRHVSGPGAGAEIVIADNVPLTIGRDGACGLRLDGSTVSRRHARLALHADRLTVECLSTGNPLWINGSAVTQGELQLWDLLIVGPHVLRVESLGGRTGARRRMDGTASLLASLLEVQRLLASEEDRVVERALHALLTALPATRLALFLSHPDGAPTQGPTATTGGDPLMSATFAQRVLAAGRAIVLDQASDGEAGFTATMREQSVCSILGVPVRRGAELAGVLLCDNRERPGRLGPDHLPVLASLASALEHVMQRDELRRLALERQRLAGEVEAARQVQEFLRLGIAATPTCGTWAVAYHPALELAGDVVAMHEDDAAISWLLVDVCGKGISAALVAAMIKGAANHRLAEGAGPEELLRGLHADLHGHLPMSRFFTAFALRVQADGAFAACGIGHPDLLVLRAGGAVERIAAGPGMLGVFVPGFACQRGRLLPDDRLVLLTDGVTEAMAPDGAMFGEDAVAAVAATVAGRPPAEVVAAIEQAVAAHRRGGEPSDDITLVAGGI